MHWQRWVVGALRWQRDRLSNGSTRARGPEKEEIKVLYDWGPSGEAETQQEEPLQTWELPKALNLELESSGHIR